MFELMISLLIILHKIWSAIKTAFPIFTSIKSLNSTQVLILATVALLAIIAIFKSINILIKKSTIQYSFNSFLGGLLGGFAGIIIGYLLGYIVSLVVPSTGDLMFGNMDKAMGFVLVLVLCWFVGIITGGIKTIKPLIRLFR